ncbi:MAG TPA: hypothetical protein VMU24_02830 [Candidatus Acidoferrales bacterium]|nr:hypothetical protein [Candidatus Acidoferrales bacterium]
MIKAQARTRTSTEKGTPVEIDYVMDARGFTFPIEDSGKRNLRYQLVVVAWNEEEKNAGQAWQMLNLDLPPKGVTDAITNGIHSKRFLTLIPGMYQIYVGVIDENSKKIGTVVIPLKVPKSKG